jgi:hypothetical protein
MADAKATSSPTPRSATSKTTNSQPPSSSPAGAPASSGRGDAAFCGSCGTAAQPGDRFCRSCGKSIQSNPSGTPTGTAAPSGSTPVTTTRGQSTSGEGTNGYAAVPRVDVLGVPRTNTSARIDSTSISQLPGPIKTPTASRVAVRSILPAPNPDVAIVVGVVEQLKGGSLQAAADDTQLTAFLLLEELAHTRGGTFARTNDAGRADRWNRAPFQGEASQHPRPDCSFQGEASQHPRPDCSFVQNHGRLTVR